ncbi:methyltransferase domain-containing protein [Cohnella zeiphila]|uniref:Methyltransferase domain-containing protein n=1 Tax=Cohnella zeiphila TaxID=2761120 RepID=A0A7X0SI04_9BACL|nr:methyltransferase domain-containing protein [Cohnella zeiphila]MBB6730317.1 methyltransferase domain-containing protein [Cohnella zeiphila]
MSEYQAQQRAVLSGKLTDVLNARTLAGANPGLARLLRPGMAILDVGCGTGAISRGIAEAVGPEGRVVGIDNNPRLIEQARSAHGDVPWLSFEVGDLYELAFEERFDVVTAARVLIWLSDPAKAVNRMAAATKEGGSVVLADYNHGRIVWDPQPPESMLAFYEAYLKWRLDAGLDNGIADRLGTLLGEAGLTDVRIEPTHEETFRDDADFIGRIALWADTASSRGPQMQRDGYLTEEAWKTAERDYREWIGRHAAHMRMYFLTATGVKTSSSLSSENGHSDGI